ncbi:hypothetical protein M9H77_36404 [Catharanthus roseus]|uniref:Uncharacterized protein n=1 Tax=Catharanthus roseus TaxID=4058 RepID=A0ACB9ZTH9_CATRO|nr:hypothetical protein M9H77_36404 [Catharanthus roseus]
MERTESSSRQGLALGSVADRSGRSHGRIVTASSRGLRGQHNFSNMPTTLVLPPSIPRRVRMPHDPYTPLPSPRNYWYWWFRSAVRGYNIDIQGDDLYGKSKHVYGKREEDVDKGFRGRLPRFVHRIQRSCHHTVDMLQLPFAAEFLIGRGDSQRVIPQTSISTTGDDLTVPMDVRASCYVLSTIENSIFTDKSGLNTSRADARDLGGYYILFKALMYLYFPMFASLVRPNAVVCSLYIQHIQLFELLGMIRGSSVLDYSLWLDSMRPLKPSSILWSRTRLRDVYYNSVLCRAFPLLVLLRHMSIVDWLALRLAPYVRELDASSTNTDDSLELDPLLPPLPRPPGARSGLPLPWKLVPDPDSKPDPDPDSLDFYILAWTICMCSQCELSLLVESVLCLLLVMTVYRAPETGPSGFNGIIGCKIFWAARCNSITYIKK